MVVEACGWEERREGKGRSGSGLCRHGWCVWVGGGRREEGGGEGEGEEATDSIEPQNSQAILFF